MTQIKEDDEQAIVVAFENVDLDLDNDGAAGVCGQLRLCWQAQVSVDILNAACYTNKDNRKSLCRFIGTEHNIIALFVDAFGFSEEQTNEIMFRELT